MKQRSLYTSGPARLSLNASFHRQRSGDRVDTRSAIPYMPSLRRCACKRGPATEEHYLACYALLPEQLVRTSCFGQGKSLRDQGLDLFLLQVVKEGDQILSK